MHNGTDSPPPPQLLSTAAACSPTVLLAQTRSQQEEFDHTGESASPYVATMVLPSPLWAEAMVKHADVKRKKLRGMVKSGEIAAGWEAKWARLPSPRRRRLLEAVREELVHAVSSYIGNDVALFDAIW